METLGSGKSSKDRAWSSDSSTGQAETHKKLALLVLGVHRSGTSAITRILSFLGARLPRNLMPPLPGVNERGFWESKEVMNLNEEALAAAGSAWDNTLPLSPLWFDSISAERCQLRIQELLESHFGDASLFVIKDPRLCLLMPLWDRALKAFGAEVRLVFIFRNPMEVIASLAKRDGFGAEKSGLLWLRYTLAAERETRGRRRSFVSYNDLLQDWMRNLEKLSAELDVEWPRSISAIQGEVEQFLSDEQHHQRQDGQYSDPPLERPIREIYGALHVLASAAVDDEASARAEASFDRIQEDFQLADSLRGLMVKDLCGGATPSGPGEPTVEEVERLSSENRRLVGAVDDLRRRLAARDYELDRRDQELRNLDRRIAGLSRALEEVRGRLATILSRLLELEVRKRVEGGEE